MAGKESTKLTCERKQESRYIPFPFETSLWSAHVATTRLEGSTLHKANFEANYTDII